MENLKSAFPDPMRGAPQSYLNQSPESLEEGMTLRDYFAAKAMQGLVSTPERRFSSDLALEAYTIADAMLKVREEK